MHQGHVGGYLDFEKAEFPTDDLIALLGGPNNTEGFGTFLLDMASPTMLHT